MELGRRWETDFFQLHTTSPHIIDYHINNIELLLHILNHADAFHVIPYHFFKVHLILFSHLCLDLSIDYFRMKLFSKFMSEFLFTPYRALRTRRLCSLSYNDLWRGSPIMNIHIKPIFFSPLLLLFSQARISSWQPCFLTRDLYPGRTNLVWIIRHQFNV